MWGTMTMELTFDAYGPISDNPGGEHLPRHRVHGPLPGREVIVIHVILLMEGGPVGVVRPPEGRVSSAPRPSCAAHPATVLPIKLYGNALRGTPWTVQLGPLRCRGPSSPATARIRGHEGRDGLQSAGGGPWGPPMRHLAVRSLAHPSPKRGASKRPRASW